MMNRKTIASLSFSIVLLAPTASWGQIVGNDVPANTQASWRTGSISAMSQRAPGRMVRAGLADFNLRHGSTLGRARLGPTIDATPPAITPEQQVRVQVLNTLFTSLNATLAAINAAIRINAGLPPLPPPPTDGGGTGGTTGGLTSLLGSITSPI